MHEDLSSLAFVNGYLSVMALESQNIKARMLTHLQEIMEDGEAYGWPVVQYYHAAWLQHMEQGRVSWEDETTKLKLRRALVWHRVLLPTESSSAPSHPTRQQAAGDEAQSLTTRRLPAPHARWQHSLLSMFPTHLVLHPSPPSSTLAFS